MTVTVNQFDIILFSFAYIHDLEQRNNNARNRLSKQDSVILFLTQSLTLERAKFAEQDNIVVNLEDIITDTKKKARRDKFKNIMLEIGLGVVIVVESALIINLLLR